MTNPLHAHLPWNLVDEALPFFLSKRLNPEFFLPIEALEQMETRKLRQTAAALEAEGLSCSLHGIFMDLNPGSFEPKLREATALRFSQVMDAASLLKPKVVVLHPGYDRWRYGEQRDRWLQLSLPLWSQVVKRGEEIGCRIAVENIFEEEPSTLVALLEGIGSPSFGHCFDVGHWNLFSTTGMAEWFAVMGKHVFECHVHDNSGKRDEHAPPGEGAVDFGLFHALVDRHAPECLLTIEAHTREALDRALHYFGRD